MKEGRGTGYLTHAGWSGHDRHDAFIDVPIHPPTLPYAPLRSPTLPYAPLRSPTLRGLPPPRYTCLDTLARFPNTSIHTPHA